MKSTTSNNGRSCGDSSKETNATSSLSASVPSEVHCEKEKEARLKALVSRVVNETVFPKKQFVILDRELDENGKLASKCLAAMRMERSKWQNMKETVRRSLGHRRNAAASSVRKSLLRKFATFCYCEKCFLT